MLRGLFKLRDAARRGATEIPEMMLSAPIRNGSRRSPPLPREGTTRSPPSQGGWHGIDLNRVRDEGFSGLTEAEGHQRLDFSEGRFRGPLRTNFPPRPPASGPPRPPPATPAVAAAMPPPASGPNWTRSGNSTPAKPAKPTNSPIKPNWSPYSAVPLTMMAGGMTANLFSSEENRGVGTFMKGAAFGLGGGLGMHMAMGSKIMSRGAASAYKASSGNPTARSFTQGAFQMARMAESQQSRAVAWGAGAMLAGTLGGSSKSKAHGINANRGNRFGG